jgi:hypothetical protein
MRMRAKLGTDGEESLCGADESAASLSGMKKSLVIILAAGAAANDNTSQSL